MMMMMMMILLMIMIEFLRSRILFTGEMLQNTNENRK